MSIADIKATSARSTRLVQDTTPLPSRRRTRDEVQRDRRYQLEAMLRQHRAKKLTNAGMDVLLRDLDRLANARHLLQERLSAFGIPLTSSQADSMADCLDPLPTEDGNDRVCVIDFDDVTSEGGALFDRDTGELFGPLFKSADEGRYFLLWLKQRYNVSLNYGANESREKLQLSQRLQEFRGETGWCTHCGGEGMTDALGQWHCCDCQLQFEPFTTE